MDITNESSYYVFMIAAPDAYDLTAQELMEKMAERRRGIDIQELVYARDAATIAASSEYQALGYCSPVEWIRKETKMTTTDAYNAVCVGEQMDNLPESVAAMVAGEIGFAH